MLKRACVLNVVNLDPEYVLLVSLTTLHVCIPVFCYHMQSFAARTHDNSILM